MTRYPDLHLYIGGQWRKTARTLPVLNPATEQEIGRLPVAGPAELDEALAAAGRGFRVWRHTPPRARADILIAAARLLRQRIDTIAEAITLEHGKPLAEAKLEVIRGCEFLE